MKFLLTPGIRMMNSLSYPKKLGLAVIFFFIPYLILATLTWHYLNDKKDAFVHLKQILHETDNINALIRDISLQRGYANAFLSGDRAFEAKMESSRVRIENDFKRLTAEEKKNTAFKKLEKHYHQIIKDLKKKSSSEIFHSYTELIGTLLYLKEGHSDIHVHGIKREVDFGSHLVKIIHVHLPRLNEAVAQQRGFGTAILVEGDISEEGRIYLTALKNESAGELKRIYYNLHAMCSEGDSACSLVQNSFESLEKKIGAFEILLDKLLIPTGEMEQINPEKFFDTATGIISESMKMDETISTLLKRRYDAELAQVHRKTAAAATFFTLALFILLYFTFSFYISFMNALKKLLDIAEAVKNGQFDIELCRWETKDELLQVAETFRRMFAEIRKKVAFLTGYQKALDASSIVTKTNTEGKITYVNDLFSTLYGYTPKEVIGHTHAVVKDPEKPEEHYRHLWETILKKKIWHGIFKNRKKSGEACYVDATIIPILNEEGQISEFVSATHDITEIIEQKKLAVHRMYTDDLTELPNRRKLLSMLHSMPSPVIVLANIDRFAQINDFYGYDTGDALLLKVTERLNEYLQSDGFTLFRTFADEFAFLSSEETIPYIQIEPFVHQLHQILTDRPYDIDGISIDIEVTIAMVNWHDIDLKEKIKPEELLLYTDMSLKKAKEEKKSYLVLKDIRSIKSKVEQNILRSERLKKAISEERIVPFGQKIVKNQKKETETVLAQDRIVPYIQKIEHNSAGEGCKYECLIRMIEPDGSVTSPWAFLEISKISKLYPHLTRIMIEKSFSFFADRNDDFSINLSIDDILDEETHRFIFDALKRFNLGERVIFEILESEGIENFETMHRFIASVKLLGCRIAIDDFGTGYSNFAYMLELNVDYIKIDGSLIKNIDTDQSSLIIVEAIVAFTKKLGIETIAEFVHSKEVYDKVVSLGIDYCQGYYLDEPKSLSELVPKHT
jgi:PAS domain S-box-containing protein/diguanylate cyclase (GGDEF)-like protein